MANEARLRKMEDVGVLSAFKADYVGASWDDLRLRYEKFYPTGDLKNMISKDAAAFSLRRTYRRMSDPIVEREVTDHEIIEQLAHERKVARLDAELKMEKRRTAQAIKDASFLEIVRETLADSILALPSIEPDTGITSEGQRAVGEHRMVALFSDWHIGDGRES